MGPEHSRRGRGDLGPVSDESVVSDLLVSPLSNDLVQQAIALFTGGGEETPEKEEEKKQVVMYLSLNSTTHHKDELPETLAAAKHSKNKGYGDYSILPISDPYDNGSETYEYSFGEKHAEEMSFWHDDPQSKDNPTGMKEGEVKFGDEEPIMLGTENASGAKELAKIQENWRTTLTKLGMDDEYIDKTITSLLKDANGDPKKLASGDGATNELLQYVMAMYRAEKGEYEVSSLVFSGHHWSADRGDDDPDYDVLAPNPDGSRNLNSVGGIGKGIWGEKKNVPKNEKYDYLSDDKTKVGGDFFSMEDVGALKSAFPTAYSQVDSVQFAACNTHSLGMTDEKGNEQSTPEWLQSTFDNIQMASYWEGLAPLAKSGASFNGEFLVDHAKMMNGDEDAAKDARYRKNGSAVNHRAMLNDKGVLEEIDVKYNRNSYFGSGIRGKDQDYDSAANKKKYGDFLYDAPDLEQTPDVWDTLRKFFGRE